jgi:hypothetical protein
VSEETAAAALRDQQYSQYKEALHVDLGTQAHAI